MILCWEFALILIFKSQLVEWNSLQTLVLQVLNCVLQNSLQKIGIHGLLTCSILCLLPPTPPHQLKSFYNTGVRPRSRPQDLRQGHLCVGSLVSSHLYLPKGPPIYNFKAPQKITASLSSSVSNLQCFFSVTQLFPEEAERRRPGYLLGKDKE